MCCSKCLVTPERLLKPWIGSGSMSADGPPACRELLLSVELVSKACGPTGLWAARAGPPEWSYNTQKGEVKPSIKNSEKYPLQLRSALSYCRFLIFDLFSAPFPVNLSRFRPIRVPPRRSVVQVCFGWKTRLWSLSTGKHLHKRTHLQYHKSSITRGKIGHKISKLFLTTTTFIFPWFLCIHWPPQNCNNIF